jgi:hypothetical protein
MMITQSTREVEEIGAVGACRGMVNIACTRCTEAINTQYREELGVVVAIGVGSDCSW